RPFSDEKYLIQGTLEKESVGLLHSSYKRFFFRLSKTDLVYYTSVSQCSWGYVPIDERGVVPVRLVTRLDENPVDAKNKPLGPNVFILYVTNAENNRYPGRNHSRPDKEFERVYKLQAMDADVKRMWCEMLQKCMAGEFNTIEDLAKRYNHAQPKDSTSSDSSKEYKTNLGRLCGGGDDWDELNIMAEEEMLRQKEQELRDAVNAKAKKYNVRGSNKLPGKAGGKKAPAGGQGAGARELNENNAMNDRRHMTVVDRPPALDEETVGEAKGGCACVVS
ncbi:hypothetical protein TeGR_g4803, partial [Tetraparma gracilis]